MVMFATKTRKPPDTPFPHTPDCKTPDSQPQWWLESGTGGLWQRVCCFTDTWRDTDAGIDPNSSSAEPSWEAHEHGPGCEATRVQQVIRTERREGNAGWRTTCLSCDWINIYYWSPGRQDAKGQPVLREGSVRYQYPLSARPVPQRHRDLAPTTGSAGHGSRPRDLRRRHTPLTHWSCG
jgi:hypothetical protein